MLIKEVPLPRRALKIAAALAAVGLVFLWMRSLKKDSTLTVPPASNTADWEFHEVKSRRELGKDLWIVSCDVVSHGFPVERMKGISAHVDGPSGVRTVRAETGEYDDGKKTLLLEKASGVWLRKDHSWDWKTPKAHWAVSHDVWTFPQGLAASSDTYFLECRSAVLKDQNEIHIEDGRIRWWDP